MIKPTLSWDQSAKPRVRRRGLGGSPGQLEAGPMTFLVVIIVEALFLRIEIVA
jgi:hypothetical protein